MRVAWLPCVAVAAAGCVVVRPADDPSVRGARVEDLTAEDWRVADASAAGRTPLVHVGVGGGTVPILVGTGEWHQWSGEGWAEAEWAADPALGLAGRCFGYNRGTSSLLTIRREKVSGTGAAVEARWYVVGPQNRDTGLRRPLCGLLFGVGAGGASAGWEDVRDTNGNGVHDPGEDRHGREWAWLAYGTIGVAIPLGREVRLVPHVSAGAVSGHDPWGGWFHIGGRLSVGF